MSIASKLIRVAVKLTPKVMIVWVANHYLKGIARLTDLNLDLDIRRVYVRTLLDGEPEAIEVLVEDFAILRQGEDYHFVLSRAQSNKPWLTHALARVAGRAWKLPHIPQLAAYLPLAAELLPPRAQG